MKTKSTFKIGVFCFLIFSIFLSIFSFSFAEKYEDLVYTNYVNDYADVLSAEKEAELNTKLKNHFEKTGNQIAVVVVQNMNGDYIENYAFRLFEKWGIGDKEKDTGALLLVSIEDKKMRIETGYGLESTLTDGVSSGILEGVVKPEFKNARYDIGIENGVDTIIKVLEDPALAAGFVAPKKNGINNADIFINLIFFMLFFGFAILQWLLAVLARSKSWWLGGVIGASFGAIIIAFFGFALIYEILFGALILLGLAVDYLVSKHFGNKLSHFDLSNPPAWWSGGTWAPGGSSWTSSSHDSFGGFGGGISGGGGSSSSW